jgi:hypothetical protein
MRVRIDEPGEDERPCGVDRLVPALADALCDRRDGRALDEDVRAEEIRRGDDRSPSYDGTDVSFSLQVWTVSPASTRTISMQSTTGHTI